MNLTEYLLDCLKEECSEIIQASCKSTRFGLDDGYPDTDRTNRGDLILELNDLFGVIEYLQDLDVLPKELVDRELIAKKKCKLDKYMNYAQDLGTLN